QGDGIFKVLERALQQLQRRAFDYELTHPSPARANLVQGECETGPQPGRSGSCPRNGIRPKRLFNICERLSSTAAKAWPCSTPAGSSASPSKDARSASQRGTVLHAERSPDHHRTLED